MFIVHCSLFIVLSTSAEAQVRTQKAGDWKDCKVWPSGRASTPKPTEHVQLDHAIKLTKDQNVGEISLGTNGGLNLNGFGIGLGGADTSVPCCVNLSNQHGAKSYITLTTSSANIDRSWGNISSVSDGNWTTAYGFTPEVQASGKTHARIRLKFSFTNGFKYKNYKVRVSGSVQALRFLEYGQSRGDCDLWIRESDDSYTIFKTAKSYSDTSVKTESFDFTLKGGDLRSVGDDYVFIVLVAARDLNYAKLGVCRVNIKDIRIAAECK